MPSESPAIARTARREVASFGVNVTLTTYSGGTADTYGDNTFSSSVAVVKAIPKIGQGNIIVSIGGEERTAAAQFWVQDTVSVALDPTRVPQVSYEGVTYEVLQVTDQQAGLLRLVADRIR